MTIGVSRIALIHENKEADVNIARRLLEHVDPLISGTVIEAASYSCSAPRCLMELFDHLELLAGEYGPILPIFLFHGNAEQGVKIGQEYVSWKYCADRLSILNKYSGNCMIVIAAACFGLNIIKNADITKPAPFKVLCAPEEKISHGDLQEKLYRFFDSLFGNNDAKQAIFSMKPPFDIIIPEVLLRKVIADGLNGLKGSVGDTNREEMISNMLGLSLIDFPRSELRANLKARISGFDERLLNEIVGVYFCGAPESFSAEDLNN